LQDLKKIQILKDGHFQQCVEEFGRLVLPLNELCGIHDNWQEFSERLNATQMKKSDIESILGKYEKLNKMNLNIDLEDSESQQTINDYLKLLEKNENQYSDLKKAMKKRIKVDLEPSFDKFCRGFMNSFGELDELILTTIYYFMAKINNLSYEIRISL
jgi:adenosine deaminase